MSSARPETIEVVSKEEIDAILKKVDKEATARKLSGFSRWIVYVIGVGWSVFQVYTAAFGLLPAQLQRSVHLAFAFVLTYLLFPFRLSAGSDRIRWHHYLLTAFAAYVGLYMAFNYTRIMEAGGDYSSMDYLFAGFGILFTLEAARRVVGLPIVCISSFFLIYAYFGAYFPGFMAHRGYSLQRIASHMYLTTEGILGIPLGVAATFIYLFILFGSFREKTGLGQLFIDISNAIAGWASGGPAKMAVITSALEGTVSGSSVANTVESGSLTIPMMKRLGYRPEFAAAVEASASTGGQIMPPIMGAAAFIMAEFLNIPYFDIAKAAAIPACLYFFGVFMEVHFEAKRCKLRGVSRDELPRFSTVVRERGHLFFPLFAIIAFLGIGYTPLYAALMGLVVCILAGALRRSTRMSPREIADAFELGARNAIGVALACASAGIIIGVITLTGLGLKMANGLVELAGGYLLPTLFFTMITSLILGMGAPTTANYIITSTIAAPALILLKVHPLAAHMFVFYFGIVADITPPVALAAYAGSGIAKSNPMKTGLIATKLAIGAFIVPYIFVYNPSMLWIGATAVGIIQTLITSCAGMTAIGASMIGFFLTRMNWFERGFYFIAGLMLIDPGTATDIVGLGILALGTLYQLRKRKAAKTGLNPLLF
ncbi:MAG: C4-dicarboxylate ABC transporter [Deltaproteobacteria bacterium RBG_13_49_15]|nr:MAG: C4-dicarboxylate ABC transporter [Deltaproteobacteria bacterium RBG_13_49_15]